MGSEGGDVDVERESVLMPCEWVQHETCERGEEDEEERERRGERERH